MFPQLKLQHKPGWMTARREHRRALRDFLERDVVMNLFALSWLENYGVVATRPGSFHFRLAFGESGQIDAVALVISERLLLLDALELDWLDELGRWYRERGYHFHHVVSNRALVERFWDAYVGMNDDPALLSLPPVVARLRSPQQMYVLTRERWQQVQGSPAYVRRSELREATIGELDAVFLASAQMHREETLENPLSGQPEVFRNHVRHRIESGRTLVWFDLHGRLMFKVDVSAQSRYGVQLSGVFTQPSFRNQGVASKAMSDACRILFSRGWPRITLYVNDENAAARHVYEKIGFVYHGDYETIFVQH